jgi:hypothetical protein
MSLIQLDLIPGSGDRLLTRDTTSHLDWLNLTATANRSYLEVLAGFGGFIGVYGFRYATNPEITGLLGRFGVTFPTGSNLDPVNAVPIETFIEFMGGQHYESGSYHVSGLFQHQFGTPGPGVSLIGFDIKLVKAMPGASLDATLLAKSDVRDPHVSSFLVKPV